MNTPTMTFDQQMDTAWNRMVSHSATLKTLRELSDPVAPPVIIEATVDSLHKAVQRVVALSEMHARDRFRLRVH